MASLSEVHYYTLEAPLSAVKLAEAAEPRRNAAGIATIPAGSTIQVTGNRSLEGLIDVVWNGQCYALFSIDLEDRGTLAAAAH